MQLEIMLGLGGQIVDLQRIQS